MILILIIQLKLKSAENISYNLTKTLSSFIVMADKPKNLNKLTVKSVYVALDYN